MCDDCNTMDEMFKHLKGQIGDYANAKNIHPLLVLEVLAELHDTLAMSLGRTEHQLQQQGVTNENLRDVNFTFAGDTTVNPDFQPEINKDMDAEFNNMIFAPGKKGTVN